MKKTLITIVSLLVSVSASATGISQAEFNRMSQVTECAALTQMMDFKALPEGVALDAQQKALKLFKANQPLLLAQAYNPSPEDLAIDFASTMMTANTNATVDVGNDAAARGVKSYGAEYMQSALNVWNSHNCPIVLESVK